MGSNQRVGVLLDHLRSGTAYSESALIAQSCSSSGWSLPRFDVGVMESFLDEYKDLKAEVYGKLQQHPDLLLPTLEGLTKGAKALPQSVESSQASFVWQRAARRQLECELGAAYGQAFFCGGVRSRYPRAWQ